MDQELIPGLPEEMARECLIRVPYHRFGLIRSVCKRWKKEFESPLFHRIRKQANLTRPVIAFTQAEPAIASTGPARKYHSSSTPSYRLTTLEPFTATWRCLRPIPGLSRSLPLFCQVAAVDRMIVVMGGWDPDTWTPVDSVHVYDFVTADWRRGARMPGPKRSFFACAAGSRSGSGSGLGLGRFVLVAGGHDEEKNALRSAMVYDVDKDEWAALPDMAAERDECKGVLLFGGRFHVVGGYSTENQGEFATSEEVFNVDTWRWGPLEEGRLDAATCPRTCVAGEDGRMWMCSGGDVVVREGNIWRVVADVPEGANVAPSVMMWQGKVMVMGAASHGGAQEAYVMVVGSGKENVAWQRVEVPAEYSGHIQTCFTFEV